MCVCVCVCVCVCKHSEISFDLINSKHSDTLWRTTNWPQLISECFQKSVFWINVYNLRDMMRVSQVCRELQARLRNWSSVIIQHGFIAIDVTSVQFKIHHTNKNRAHARTCACPNLQPFSPHIVLTCCVSFRLCAFCLLSVVPINGTMRLGRRFCSQASIPSSGHHVHLVP